MLKPHRSSRRGNYSIFMSTAFPVFFGFMALALDLSYVGLASVQAQHIADAASHAAFVAFRGAPSDASPTAAGRAAAEYVLSVNRIGVERPDLEGVSFGGWSPETGRFEVGAGYINAARVDVSRRDDNRLQLFIAPMFGMEAPDIQTRATTAGRTREIVIAQDITGSFFDDIDDARDANLAFAQYMIDNQYPGDRVGMTTFVGGVEPTAWDPIRLVRGNEDDILTKWATLDSCNCDLPGYESWCSYHYGNANGQPHMQDCFEYGAQTAPGAGVEQAVDELLGVGNPTSFQAVILVGDGLPCCDNPPYWTTAERRAASEAAVERAWENGIHVWVVAFQNGGGDFSWFRTLVRGQGAAYLTPDSTQLTDIMLEIASSIPVTLVQ